MIKTTRERLSSEDRQILTKLVEELVVEETLDEFVQKVRVLVPEFLDGEMVSEDIDQLLMALESSLLISKKTVLLKLKMLLDDIESTFYRVYQILTRMNDTNDKELTLKQIAKEKLIDSELYDELKDTDISIYKLANIL